MAKRDLPSLLKSGRLVVAPGAVDAFGARMIELHGFPAVYLTGYGVTASRLGRPDIGFVTLNDMAAAVRGICQVLEVPLIADAESGFGNAVNLVRTVREYEQAGAAAIHLEDQVVPRKHGGSALPEVVPGEEHAAKIRLAVRSRRSPRFLIIGRTDCLPTLGLAEAIRRGNLYREAGADITFVHGISTRDELRDVGRYVRGPKLVNYSALTLSADPAPPALAEMSALGFSIVILAIEPLFAAAKAMGAMLETLRRREPVASVRALMEAKGTVETVTAAAHYHDLEDAYLPRMAAEARPGVGRPRRTVRQ
jgi:2-methylisocitrate lyase-like PEP mutase family enzyme